MRLSRSGLAVAVSLVLALHVPAALATKAPLTPEQLLEESKLIVVGTVESHRDEEEVSPDGSKTRHVFLTVRVESVAKGQDTTKAGDAVTARFWVVTALPRDGSQVWDAGHYNIPGDGGRARFFCDGRSGDAWTVIYPNGVERLDETPVLVFAPEAAADTKPGAQPAAVSPAAQGAARPRWLIVGLSVGGLLLAALMVWRIASRPRTG